MAIEKVKNVNRTHAGEKGGSRIDGRRYYYMFLAGARKIMENQAALNRINVFPVRDGDTGTNMAATVRAVIDSVKPTRSYKIMAESIAESSLLNARGNSGIIFAQFLYGVSSETGAAGSVTLDQFIDSIRRSVRHVYDAVANPVEGTMLTVIRTWAEFIYTNKHRFRDFNHLFLSSKSPLDTALAQTKNTLQVLKRANVVDAGARAFVHFIEGMIDFIHHRNIRQLISSRIEIPEIPLAEGILSEGVGKRYCTEAVIREMSIERETLVSMLNDAGDSVVIAGSPGAGRIHLHTDDPASLFERLRQYGTITYQKADDMLRQSQAAAGRKWETALVTDSACDLSQELFDYFQVHLLPLNIFFGDNHYLDRVTLQPEQFYRRLAGDTEFPRTAQVNEAACEAMYSHLASHYRAVIAVHLTGRFSGTFSGSAGAAAKASSRFGTPITVIDSKTLSGAQGLLVLRIARAIEAGMDYRKIVERAKTWAEHTRIFVSVRTLKYMVRGGRVSHAKGLIARLLNINPIVTMAPDGSSAVFGKTFSQMSNMRKVIGHITEIIEDRPVWNYTVMHAGNPGAAAWYSDRMRALTGKHPASVVNISPVIGANAGPGSAAVAFMYE
ncbi:DegV family EDD domain-containing protein [bacterium]|nr:DegV family EDD domain-containing protein [bacterium]